VVGLWQVAVAAEVVDHPAKDVQRSDVLDGVYAVVHLLVDLQVSRRCALTPGLAGLCQGQSAAVFRGPAAGGKIVVHGVEVDALPVEGAELGGEGAPGPLPGIGGNVVENPPMRLGQVFLGEGGTEMPTMISLAAPLQ
jgi:hypothetical protein